MTSIEASNAVLPQRKKSVQGMFIASRTVANVLAKVKPPSNRRLVDLPSTATMEEAFDVLLAEDILSVPVYELQADNTKKYLTIISVLDLLKLLSSHAAADRADVLLKPLKEAIGMTTESSHLVTVRPSDSLEYVIGLFSQHGSHRVLVQSVDDSSEPVLLSQMDVVRYLQANNHRLGRILDVTTPTIVERSRARRGSSADMRTITFKSTAMDAFLKMANEKLGALPIVDDDDTLVGELSPENLRGLNRDRFDTLQKPVMMYLKESEGDIYPPQTCHDRFTLSQIMAAFVLRKAHRLWWCDDMGHIKGVITLSDFLGTFIDNDLVTE